MQRERWKQILQNTPFDVISLQEETNFSYAALISAQSMHREQNHPFY